MQSLLEALAPAIFSAARRILSEAADVEEAAQETMIVLVRDLPTLREPAAVISFAQRAASRIALRQRQRQRRETAGRSELRQRPAADGSAPPDLTSQLRERAQRILEHLEALPEGQAEAMVMQHVLGCSPSEIANAMQIPVNTVRSRVRLARRSLAKRLDADPHFGRDDDVEEALN